MSEASDPSVLHCDILEGRAICHFQANDGKEFRWSRFSAADLVRQTRVVVQRKLWVAAAHVLSRGKARPTSDKRASPSSVTSCNIM